MRSRISRQVATFTLAGALVAGFAALAAPANAQLPGGHLRITEVFVDIDAERITITGEDFDFKDISNVEVTLGALAGGDGPGDITTYCVSISPTEIVCDLSGSPFPADGDYLLTVMTLGGCHATASPDRKIVWR